MTTMVNGCRYELRLLDNGSVEVSDGDPENPGMARFVGWIDETDESMTRFPQFAELCAALEPAVTELRGGKR